IFVNFYMPQSQNEFFQSSHSTVTLKDKIRTYFAYWPLIITCVLVCICIASLYIAFTNSKYLAATSFIVKGSEQGTPTSKDLIESAVNGGKKEINLNDEILLLNASSLMERTVAKNGFNISYYKKDRFKNIDVYQNAPFSLVAKKLTDSNKTYEFNIKRLDINGGDFLYGSDKIEKLFPFHWNEPFTIGSQQFVLIPSGKGNYVAQDVDYTVRWQPVWQAASKFSQSLLTKASDKANVIELSIKAENLDEGVDLLNALFEEFNMSDMEDRKKLSDNTIEFIDERLLSNSRELQGAEGNLKNYRGNNQLIDMRDQSKRSLDESDSISKAMKDLTIHQSIVDMILNYTNNPANANKLVPSSLGLNDGTLASLIVQYNELKLKKERETPLVASNSTVIQDLNMQLSNLKVSLNESLNNINKNLQMQENNLREQNSQNKTHLSSIPHNERILQEIKRKQNISEGLYLYLLQKREEAAISGTASDVAHYKQIDMATGYGPVEPNTSNIIIYATLFGFFLAFGWIYVHNIFNDKVNSKQEVMQRTSLPVIGQINHIPKKEKEVLQVWGITAIGEQFRSIRSAVYSQLKEKNKKIVLITSSTNGEGKSFTSLNLAAVCAIPGKKVALLEFDIRKPTIARKLNLENSRGLTQFLTGEITNLTDISYALNKIPSLHVYPSGPVPMNPADLLSGEVLNRLFETLKTKYDYIIIDSPPAGIVSDSFILREFGDLVLYIVRFQKTLKKQLDFIKESNENISPRNTAIILNDVKTADNYGFSYKDQYNYDRMNGTAKKINNTFPVES